MKIIISLLLLFLYSSIYSQEIKYEEVIKVDSTISNQELFNRARSWFGKTFNNEKFVLATEDRQSGELSGNGTLSYNTRKLFFGVGAVIGSVDYKVNIYVKDGRYKYVFHSFRHEGSYVGSSSPISYGLLTQAPEAPKPTRGPANNKAWNDIKEQTSGKISNVIEGLKTAMNTAYEGGKDW